jgi:hypothetical protein
VVTAGVGADPSDFSSQFLEAISAHRHWGREKDRVPA